MSICHHGSIVDISSLRQPPIGFAHRGARAHARDNTLEAFELAVRLGATGLESDVWITADGIPILDHDGVVGRVRRRKVSTLRRDELPAHIPTLAELYSTVGGDLPLSLDVKDATAVAATVAVARDFAAEEQLWLCHHDHLALAGWTSGAPRSHLVDSTHFDRIKEGPERRAASLSEAGIGTINMHHSVWSSGLVAMFHRFGIECFAWDLQQPHRLKDLLAMGVDGIYSDHVDRMMESLGLLEIRRSHGS